MSLLQDAREQAATWITPQSDNYTPQGQGGSGKSGSFDEEPNSLQSKSIGTVLDLISEGEIRGLVNGAKSILFNKVAAENADGTQNFKGLSYAVLYGLPDQPVLPGFTAVQEPLPGFTKTQLQQIVGPVSYEVTDPTVDALILTISVPSLSYTDNKKSKMTGTSVNVTVNVTSGVGSANPSTVEALDITINGKTTGEYDEDYRINLAQFGEGPWQVSCTRTTADSQLVELSNETYWSNAQVVYDHKFTFPYSAIVGVQVDAQYFGSSIPTRQYDIYGLIISVPSNYDPIARNYTGLWDGTFKQAWTNNPAWIFYDLCTNERYGLGIPTVNMDKWTLYTIAQYCDAVDANGNYQGVADGFGNLEPRFTFNGVISQAQDAYTVLTALASTFRGMIYWSAGMVTASQDAPGSSSKIFTPANVINGDFEYTGSSLLARHTCYVVAWNNPLMNYELDYEVIEDPDGIAKYGLRVEDMTAMGCTSRGQAVRAGRWALGAEALNLDTVKFKTGFEGADVTPGALINIADPAYAGIRMGGRILSVAADGSSLVMDTVFNFLAGESYSITVMGASGELYTENVANRSGSSQTVQLVADLPTQDLPVAGAIFTLTEVGNVAPRIFRVISASEDDTGTQWEIVGLLHDPSLYQIADDYASFDTVAANTFSALPNPAYCLPPGAVTATLQTQGTNATTLPVLYISWIASPDPLIQGYIVSYQEDLGNWVQLPLTNSTSAQIRDAPIANYNIRVMAVNQLGTPSSVVTTSLDLATLGTATDLNLISNIATDFPDGEFRGGDCTITWSAAPISAPQSTSGNGIDAYFAGFQIKVYNGETLIRTDSSSTQSYTYTLANNQADNGGTPSRNIQFSVATISTDGSVSNAATLACSNNPPVVPVVGWTATISALHMVFDQPTDIDYVGVEVWASGTSGFTPGPSTRVWNGSGAPTIPGVADETFYIRYLFYDAFGTEGCVMSAEIEQTISDLSQLTAQINTAVDEAIGDLNQQISDIGDTEDALLANAIGDLQDLLTLHAQDFTPAGLPNGTTIDQHTTSINGHTQLFNLLGQANNGDTAFILNTSDVWVDDNGTTLAYQTSQLQASINGVSSNLTTNYMTAVNVTSAIAALQTSLTASINGVSASLTTNYLTSVQVNQAIATAQTTLQANINGVSSNLTNNYSTTVQLNQAIASAQTTLQSSINGVSSNLSNNYYTSAQVNSAISSAQTTLQSNINGVSANLTNNYQTSAQVNQAISNLNTSLTASINGVSATVSGHQTAIANINGQLSASYTLTLNANNEIAGMEILTSSGPVSLSTIRFSADTTEITGNLIVDGTITTPSLANNTVTNTVIYQGSSNTQGTGNEVAVFNQTIVLTEPAYVVVMGSICFVDGGGNSAGYHVSKVRLVVNGSQVATNPVNGAGAVQTLDALGAIYMGAGTYTVTLYGTTQPADSYTYTTLVTNWYYK